MSSTTRTLGILLMIVTQMLAGLIGWRLHINLYVTIVVAVFIIALTWAAASFFKNSGRGEPIPGIEVKPAQEFMLLSKVQHGQRWYFFAIPTGSTVPVAISYHEEPVAEPGGRFYV